MACAKVELSRQNRKAGATLSATNKITRDMRFKLVKDMRRRHPHAGLVVFWVKLRQCGDTRSISGLYQLLRRIDGKPLKLPNPKPYEKMDYPGLRGQIDVKYVPSVCLVEEAAGEKYYQYIFNDELFLR